MSHNPQELNDLLVSLFYDVERMEERALTGGQFSDLSLREMHVIDQVCRAQTERPARMSELARRLSITKGSLTVAVKTLEKKGYLSRVQDGGDRRITFVRPTPRGEAADALHTLYHQKLVGAVTDALDQQQLEVLVRALAAVRAYFSENGVA